MTSSEQHSDRMKLSVLQQQRTSMEMLRLLNERLASAVAEKKQQEQLNQRDRNFENSPQYRCYFCKKWNVHFKRDCLKYKQWLAKQQNSRHVHEQTVNDDSKNSSSNSAPVSEPSRVQCESTKSETNFGMRIRFIFEESDGIFRKIWQMVYTNLTPNVKSLVELFRQRFDIMKNCKVELILDDFELHYLEKIHVLHENDTVIVKVGNVRPTVKVIENDHLVSSHASKSLKYNFSSCSRHRRMYSLSSESDCRHRHRKRNISRSKSRYRRSSRKSNRRRKRSKSSSTSPDCREIPRSGIGTVQSLGASAGRRPKRNFSYLYDY